MGKSLNSSLGGNNAGAVTYVYKNSASSAYVGGIVGYADKGTCIFQNNTAAVTMSGVPETATAFYAGGVAGCYDGETETASAYIESGSDNTGAVTGASYSGLSVGYWKSGDVYNRDYVSGKALGKCSVENAKIGLAPLAMSGSPKLFRVSAVGEEEVEVEIEADKLSGALSTPYDPVDPLRLRVSNLVYPRDYQVVCTDASGRTYSPVPLESDDGISLSNLPADTYTFTITGQGGYYGETETELTITPQEVESGLRAEPVNTFKPVYSGKAIVPEQKDVKIYLGETEVGGVSFEVDTESELPDNVNAGEVILPIKVTGNYIGTTTVTYTIAKRTLTAADVVFYLDEIPVETLTYTGQQQLLWAKVPSVEDDSLQAEDFSLTYWDEEENPIETVDGLAPVKYAGAYTAQVQVNENCRNYAAGTVTKSIDVQPLNVADSSDCPVIIQDTAPVYTGEAFQPDALVTAYWEEDSIAADWYTVTCAKEIRAAGSYTLQVAFAGGSLTGTLEHTVQVQPRPITASEITVSPLPETSFTGLVHAVGEDAVVMDGEKQLTAQTDYIWSYYADSGCKVMLEETDVRNAGTYYLKVEGAGNYGSFRVVPFQIGQIALEYGSAFSLEDHYFALGNSPVRPTPQFLYEDAAHFQVTYANNTQPGTATMTVRTLSTAVNYVPGSEVTVEYTILADAKDRVQAILDATQGEGEVTSFTFFVGGSDIPEGVYSLPVPKTYKPCRYVTVRVETYSPSNMGSPASSVEDTTAYLPGVPVYLRENTNYILEFHY